MEIRLPPANIKQMEARKLTQQKSVSGRMLAQLSGKMNATNCPRPPILLPPANSANEYIGAELPMLRSASPPYTGLPGGAGMVGQQHVQVERQNSHSKGSRSAYINNLGGTASKELVILTRDLWMWCLERNISALARCVEHHSQHRVQGNAGQDRLEVEPHDIPGDQQPLWAYRRGPVCVQTVHPVPTLLQLPARSLCTSNRCLSPRLDSHEVLCQSSMEPGGTGSCSSTIPTGSSGVNSPSF